jgi:hypothetical protein
MVNFAIGDKVKVTVLPQGSEGTILSIYDRFYVIEFIDKHGEPYTYAYEKHELIKVDAYFKCECGAVYTWAPNQHSTWCPKWRIDGN